MVCSVGHVIKNDFYQPYTHKGHIWIRWIRSTLLPEEGWPDPNPKDPDPDPTNRKGANPVDPVDRDPDPTNRTCPKIGQDEDIQHAL